jgi:DNA-binding CsgD family transcriptional regulator/transposase-like protein
VSRRISKWHVARIRAAHRRTGSVAIAAEAAGVSLPTAYRVLADVVKQAGYTMRVVREAVDLYRAGYSARGVARILGERMSPAPSHESVSGWARAAGVDRSKSRAQEVRAARLAARDYDALRRRARFLATEKLWSVRQIACTLKVSRNFVLRSVPKSYRCGLSLSIERRMWQAHLPDVERRRQIRDEVILRRKQGETYPEIAAATGLSHSTVYHYCHQAGLTTPTVATRLKWGLDARPRRGRRVSEEIRQDAIARRKRGEILAEIATALNISITTAYRYCRADVNRSAE